MKHLSETGLSLSQAQSISNICYQKAQKYYHVYHINMMHGIGATERSHNYWKQLLGDNCIEITNPKEVAETVANIVVKHYKEDYMGATLDEQFPTEEDKTDFTDAFIKK